MERKAFIQRALIAVVVVLLAIQLIPANRDNPPVQAEQTLFAVEAVPPPAQQILQTSCQDCHSNQTRWPWYSYVAPASWIVSHDVHEARSHVNFSTWGTYTAKQRERRLEDMCEQVMNGDMPDSKYVFIHRGARLSQEQREVVCAWTNKGPSAQATP